MRDRGAARENALQDVKAAPRLVVEAVVLIADVAARAVVVARDEIALDEEDLVQTGERRIREVEAALGRGCNRILALDYHFWRSSVRGGEHIHMLRRRGIQLEEVLDKVVDIR